MAAEKILVIEDAEDTLQLVVFLLERLGYQMSSAMDGVTGLAMAKEIMPHMILLDLAIPEMDGWKVAEKIKQDQATKDIIIVAFTAKSAPEDKRHAKSLGISGYITKPITNVEKFGEKIAAFLSGEFSEEW